MRREGARFFGDLGFRASKHKNLALFSSAMNKGTTLEGSGNALAPKP